MRLNEIVEKYNHDETFALGDGTVVISAAKNIYCQIHNKYSQLAQEAFQKYMTHYEQFQSLDDLVDNGVDILISCMPPIINEIAQDAISMDFYTLDSDTILSLCAEQNYFGIYLQCIKNCSDGRDQILEAIANAEAYREYQKQSRGRWEQVTFSNRLRDAVVNEVKVGALNAAIGMGYNLLNSCANKTQRQKAEEQMQQIFNSLELKLQISAAAKGGYENMHLLLADLISGVFENGKATKEESAQADAMFKNLQKLEISREKQHEIIRRILTLVPDNPFYYSYFLMNFTELRDELLKITNYLYLDMQQEKVEIFKEFVKKIIEEYNSISVMDGTNEATLPTLETFIVKYDKAKEYARIIGLSEELCKEQFDLLHIHIIDNFKSCVKELLRSDNTNIDECVEYIETQKNQYPLLGDMSGVIDYLYQIIDDNIFNYISSQLNKSTDNTKICIEYINELKKHHHLPDRAYEKTLCFVYEMIEENMNSYLREQLSFEDKADKIKGFGKQYREYAMAEGLTELEFAVYERLYFEKRLGFVSEYVFRNLGTTEEEAQQCLDNVKEYAISIGVSEQEYAGLPFEEQIKERLREFDKQYRIVDDIELETREEAEISRKIMEDHTSLFLIPLAFERVEQIDDLMHQLENLPLNEQIKKKYMRQYETARINFMHNNARIIIANPPEMIRRSDYERFIEQIKQLDLPKEELDKAIETWTQKLNAFDSDCIAAKKHEQRLKHHGIWTGEVKDFSTQIIILIIGAVLTIVGFRSSVSSGIIWLGLTTAILLTTTVPTYEEWEKSWKRVTHDGKYPLNAVLGRKSKKKSKKVKENYVMIMILVLAIVAGIVVVVFFLKNQQEQQNSLQYAELSQATESVPDTVTDINQSLYEISETTTESVTEIVVTEASESIGQYPGGLDDDGPGGVAIPAYLNDLGYGTVYSSDGFLNLRNDPSLSDNILLEIPSGASVYVYDCGNTDWYFVEYGSSEGYVKRSYVTLDHNQQFDGVYGDGLSPDEAAHYHYYELLKDWSNDTEGYLYDIDQDGIDEMILKDLDTMKFALYTYHSTLGLYEFYFGGFYTMAFDHLYDVTGTNGEHYLYWRDEYQYKSYQGYYHPKNTNELEVSIIYPDENGVYYADWSIWDYDKMIDSGYEWVETFYAQPAQCHDALISALPACGFYINENSKYTKIECLSYNELCNRTNVY